MKLPKSLRGNTLVFGVTSFLTDVSSEMVFPLLPLFIVQALGAPASVLGLIEGIAESTSSLLKLASGVYSDKIKKKKGLVILGYGISTVSKPLFAIATAWPQVLAFRFADRAGKGIRTSPRDALIAQSTNKKIRGEAFGFHRMMDTLGAVLGPFLAFAILFLSPENYRLVFALSAIPAALAVIVLWAFVKEKRSKQKPFETTSLKKLPKKFKRFLFTTGLFALANFSFAFLLLRASELGVPGELIPIVYLFFNLVYAATTVPAGKASDKWGRRNVIAGGYLLFAVVCALLASSSNAWVIIPAFALYGVFMGTADTVQRAAASELAPSKLRGSALGAFHGAVGIAALPASVIAGGLWQFAGAPAAFGVAAVIAVASAIMMKWFK